MENKKFDKLDTLKNFWVYSKIKEGAYAKVNAIISLIMGIAAWAFIPVMLSWNLKLDTEFTKYFTIIFFACVGTGSIAGAFYSFRRYRRYRAIITPIFENGLLTEGCIVNLEVKRRFRGLFSSRGWKYKATYTYFDDKGIECKDTIKLISVEKKDWDTNKNILIAFYNGQSIIIEMM